MTVEIDPAHPELFTCAWVSLPVKSVVFPLMMGQTSTPACLLDGRAYALGRKVKAKTQSWEEVERGMHADKERIQKQLADGLSASNSRKTARTIDQWSQQQAEMLVELLEKKQ